MENLNNILVDCYDIPRYAFVPVVYRHFRYYAAKQQNANGEFLSCFENRNSIVFTCVGDILSPVICEQLRSLRVNRERTPVISVKYIAETVTLPEIEDSEVAQAWACKDLFTLLEGRNRNPDEGMLGRSVVTERWFHFRICSKDQKEKVRRNDLVC